ncbi:MAG TPA: hypothetical protein VGG89_14170 [Candidatus Baltobacteraceae bacterium]
MQRHPHAHLRPRREIVPTRGTLAVNGGPERVLRPFEDEEKRITLRPKQSPVEALGNRLQHRARQFAGIRM